MIGPGRDRHFGYRMLARESRDVATANADIGKFAIGEKRKLVHGVVVALPCAEVAGNGCEHGRTVVARSQRPRWRFSDAFIGRHDQDRHSPGMDLDARFFLDQRFERQPRAAFRPSCSRGAALISS